MSVKKILFLFMLIPLLAIAKSGMTVRLGEFGALSQKNLIFSPDKYTTIVKKDGKYVAKVNVPPKARLKGSWYGVRTSFSTTGLNRQTLAFSIKANGISEFGSKTKSRIKFVIRYVNSAGKSKCSGCNGNSAIKRWRTMKFKSTFVNPRKEARLFIGIEGNQGIVEFDLSSLKITKKASTKKVSNKKASNKKASNKKASNRKTYTVGPLKDVPFKINFIPDKYTTLKKINGKLIATVNIATQNKVKPKWYGLKANIPVKKLKQKDITFYIKAKGLEKLEPGNKSHLKFIISYKNRKGSMCHPGCNGDNTERWQMLKFRHKFNSPTGTGKFFIGIEGNQGKATFDLSSLRSQDPEPMPEVTNKANVIPVGLNVKLPAPIGREILTKKPFKIKLSSSSKISRIMLKVRSSRQNAAQTLYGGYDCFLPEMSYKFKLNGVKVKPIISPRTPISTGKDKKRNEQFTGYLYIDLSQKLVPDSILSISSSLPDNVVYGIYLLNKSQVQAEDIIASSLFHPLKDSSGVGYQALWFTTKNMIFPYPVDSLSKMLSALQKLPESFNFPKDKFVKHGQELKIKVNKFFNDDKRTAEDTEKQGEAIALDWQDYRNALYASCRTALLPVLKKQKANIVRIISNTSELCHSGRFAKFRADIVKKYIDNAQKNINKNRTEAKIFNFKELIHILSSVYHAQENLVQAQKLASMPQTKVEYRDFATKKKFTVSIKSNNLPLNKYCSLLLNGIWDYAPVLPETTPDKLDVMPKKWFKNPIPYGSLHTFYNPEKKTDKEVAKKWFAYWKSSKIKNCWFKTKFNVPDKWQNSHIDLKFNEVSFVAEVFVNGQYAGMHLGGMKPFKIDVTDFIVPGVENSLQVLVTSESEIMLDKKKALYPIAIQVKPALRISGDVVLLASPKVRVENIYIQTSVRDENIQVTGKLINDINKEVNAKIIMNVMYGNKTVLTLPVQIVKVPPKSYTGFSCKLNFPNPKLWGIGGEYGDPHNRYSLKCKVRYNNKTSAYMTPFAFRELSIVGRKIYLNGKEYTIQGSSTRKSPYQVRLNKDNIYWGYYESYALRFAYINFLRFHRFNLHDWSVKVCDDTGIISAGEAPWWGLFTPPDINGDVDINDPVWVSTSMDYYQKTIRKFRNSPSMLMFSIQNETMNRTNASIFKRFREVMQKEAPHMLVYGQSIATLDSTDDPLAVIHDYGIGYKKIAEYARKCNKPFIVGEYWNHKLFMKNSDPRQASGAGEQSAKYLRQSIKKYFKCGAAGVMPYGFEISGVLGSLSSVKNYGPWGEIVSQTPLPRYSIPVKWPAFTGSGGYRVSNMLFADTRQDPFNSNYRFYINFWDKSRPSMTPTVVMNGFREGFSPLPDISLKRSPELIVTVYDGKTCLKNVNVFISSAFMNPMGVKTDKNGRALFFLPVASEYLVSLKHKSKLYSTSVNVKKSIIGIPGYDFIDRLYFDLKSGKNKFIAGKNQSMPNFSEEIAKASVSTTKKSIIDITPKKVFNVEQLNPGKPIRNWLIIGPFPNEGERPNCRGFNKDFLGGESNISPRDGDKVKTVFPKCDTVTWEAGRIVNKWTPCLTKKTGNVDLGNLLLRSDVSGLNVSPLSCVVGYAYTVVNAAHGGKYVLKVKTYSGIKVWLNGKLIMNSHKHTFSRDPASPFLPPTVLQELSTEITLKKGSNRILVKNDVDYGDMICKLIIQEYAPDS